MLTTTSIKDKREKLLGFIDQKAFDAILRLPPETYSGKDREEFETVRKKTLEDKRKFHAYRTPEEIKENFLSDASAYGLKKNNGQVLQYLDHLSALPEVKEEFIGLCNELGV
jgi:hypothetical protein